MGDIEEYDETAELAKYAKLKEEIEYLTQTATKPDEKVKLNELKAKAKMVRSSLRNMSESLDEEIASQVAEEVVRRIADNVQRQTMLATEEEQRKLLDGIISEELPEKARTILMTNVLGIVRSDKNRRERKMIQDGWEKVKEVKTKTTDVRIRMTLDEKEHMQDNAEKYGYKNLSEYIRQVALSNPKKNPAAAAIYKYELSEDNLGLLAYFRSDNPIPDASFYHIHSTEMTDDQRIIYELLMLRKITELERSQLPRMS